MVKTVGAFVFLWLSFFFVALALKINNCMQTLLVEIKDQNGLRILQDLERAKIIRLVSENTSIHKAVNLSKRLRGSISKETTADMLSELEQTRNEWQARNI